jgi:hypothetical protein
MKCITIVIANFVFFTLLSCGSNQKQKEPKYSVSDSTIYSFINTILTDTSIIHCNTLTSSDGEKLSFYRRL